MTFLLSLFGYRRFSSIIGGCRQFMNSFSTPSIINNATKKSTEARCGLYDFFEDGKSLPNVLIDKEKVYGREWKASELRNKSFSDLHSLWFILLKEMNLLHTQRAEAKRVDLPWEGRARIVKCQFSMARIKTVLSERMDVWRRAKKVYNDSLIMKNNSSYPGKTSLIWAEGEILMNIFKQMKLKNKERDRDVRKRNNFIRGRRPLFH